MLRAKTVPRLEDCVDMIVSYCLPGRMKSIKVVVFELNWKGSLVNFEDKLHRILQYKLKVIIIVYGTAFQSGAAEQLSTHAALQTL